MSKTQLSDFQRRLVASILDVEEADSQPAKRKISAAFLDPFDTGTPLSKEEQALRDRADAGATPLAKSMRNLLNGPGRDSIERLAFEVQPHMVPVYGGLWIPKRQLLPDEILKRISIQDDLVAAIVNTRSNQIAAFGRPQPDRFSTGFKIEPQPGYTNNLSSEEKKKLQDQISEAELRMLTCGSNRGMDDHDQISLDQYLFMSARNAVVFGRTATEIVYVEGGSGRQFHSFLPIDAGTIFRAAPYKEAAQAVRENALRTLEGIKNKKLVPERFIADEYTWIQVIDGRPEQAFTNKECLVHNFYPVTDVELGGYPLTPLDTVITAVTTHINIGTHNKLYFQSGRAARGMIVVKSDDVDEGITNHIRQQFQASINSVGNSWRMPIFGIGSDDEIAWYPIDNSSRDMEFQYLSDTNSRVIMSAFQLSPEELPGYAHLSRGTNSQALSESSTEYRLEAARDVGIRPLLSHFQNFINAKILPLIAPELAKFCHFKFVGLDAETAEKESTRLQQDQAVHMTMDEVLEKVQKDPVGKRWAGRFLLNPAWQAVLDKYFLVGDILEHFFGIEGASQDPRFQFVNNPMWFNWQQLQAQAQQAQQQAQQPQQEDPQQGDQEEQGDLTRSVDQLGQTLGKSEQQLPHSRRKLLDHQRRVITNVLKGLEDDAEAATAEILKVAALHLPKKLRE